MKFTLQVEQGKTHSVLVWHGFNASHLAPDIDYLMMRYTIIWNSIGVNDTSDRA